MVKQPSNDALSVRAGLATEQSEVFTNYVNLYRGVLLQSFEKMTLASLSFSMFVNSYNKSISDATRRAIYY